jgi:arylsulfatase A-like enzyme
LDERTRIVFLSDHGTEAKGGAYQGGTLTAGFVWKKNGFPVGHRTDAALQLQDLAPTLLAWAGVAAPDWRPDGVSFAGILDGTDREIHEALYFEMGYSRAVLQDGFKYLALRYPQEVRAMTLEERTRILDESNAKLRQRGRPLPTEDPSAPFSHLFLIPGGHDADQVAIRSIPGYFAADQLYDLRNDPAEQHNLAGDPAYREVLSRLRRLLDDRIRSLPGLFGEFGEIP